MERLRQPELNRYYLELKYISNTHTRWLHDTMLYYVIIHYTYTYIPIYIYVNT